MNPRDISGKADEDQMDEQSVVGDDIVGQQGMVWTRTAKDRESWRTLGEGYFLQWKDTE